MKYEDFIFDPDAHIKNTKIINFEMTHAQCCGQPRTHSNKYFQTLTKEEVWKMPEKDKKKSIGAYLRSPRKDIFVEKKLAFSILLRWTKMSNYEIFGLLYSDIIDKIWCWQKGLYTQICCW